MSEPTYTPLVVGDIHDDDPDVLASMVGIVSDSPAPEDLPYVAGAQVSPKRRRRRPSPLLTGYYSLDPSFIGATMILPADSYRTSLTVRVSSPSGSTTDYVSVSDDAGKVAVPNGSGRLYSGHALSVDTHTGPLWVAAWGNAGGAPGAVIGVSYWAVRTTEDED
jgi:hypothetical protein